MVWGIAFRCGRIRDKGDNSPRTGHLGAEDSAAYPNRLFALQGLLPTLVGDAIRRIIEVMVDVTASVFGAFFLASYVVDHPAPPSTRSKLIGFLLLVAAAASLWTRAYLPISATLADMLIFTIIAAWIGFLAFAAPKWLQEAKAHARG